ncbi:GNAT family N-acetyltransferase [Persicobacter psychrovividus]|uniref:N-acetyltransferase n=1 Tax=Persicobacter psychrovividus TaxID=387638 RepID=A0ABM7VFH8_9BACT|nr:N-acetyltransferase [Persicobacter psychrovividus]
MQIKIDDLQGDAIKALLKEHHTDMYATSPKESVHTLGIDHLKSADITFFTAWEADQLLGCLAIKAHSEDQVELKSMRTSKVVRNKGVASQLLHHVLRFAKEKGFRHVHLETGTQDYFSAARQLYKKFQFTDCPPFGDYQPDPNSHFMYLDLQHFPVRENQ